jgi:hypothetical protein
MVRRAARGRGVKKNLKVTLKDVKVAMEEASRDVDGDAELSEAERNGEFLECGTQEENGLEERLRYIMFYPGLRLFTRGIQKFLG